MLRMQHSAKLTLFTRVNCSLCVPVKASIAEVQKRRPFTYQEIDVMAYGQEKWKSSYEFEVPVLHVERIFHTYSKPDIISEPRKLMHRFTEKDIEKLIDEAEAGLT